MLFAEMSGGEIAIVIASIAAALVTVISAVFSGIAALYAVRAKKGTEANSKDLRIVKTDVEDAKNDIRKVEVATNSMKDALVESTKKSSFADGAAYERAKAEAKAGVIVQADTQAVQPPLEPAAPENPVDVKIIHEVNKPLPVTQTKQTNPPGAT